jgi:CBS domain containing-hemolysin-like protein
LITIEDIIEEIVGEIDDEHDPVPQDLVQPMGDSQVEVDARIHVDEFNERLDVSLPEDDGFDTLGGFIVSHLGRIPAVGEGFDWKNLHFTVTEADERRVHRLEIVVVGEGSPSTGG